MTIYYKSDDFVIRDAEAADIEAMKNNLRAEEVAELYAAAHQTPEEGLKSSYELSTLRLTAIYNGTPFAMFGVVPDSLLGRTGQTWLLTTDDLLKVKKRFLKMSKIVIQFFLSRYSLLYNYVDARHTRSIEWLKRCGAKVEPAHPYGADNLNFHRFTLGAI